MQPDDEMPLVKLVGRQRRPATGDVFRVRLTNGDYYFGMVVDGNMEIGPMAPGSILVVIFSGSSKNGEFSNLDDLPSRPLLMPPAIVNQRPWTLGYAEKLGATERRPEIECKFMRYAFNKMVDVRGNEIQASPDKLTGTWGLGNEWTLGDDIIAALSRQAGTSKS